MSSMIPSLGGEKDSGRERKVRGFSTLRNHTTKTRTTATVPLSGREYEIAPEKMNLPENQRNSTGKRGKHT